MSAREGFWQGFKNHLVNEFRKIGREWWEEVKADWKSQRKKIKEEIRQEKMRENLRKSASIPLDVETIVAQTPETETAEIPFRSDTKIFCDNPLNEDDYKRGWTSGTIKGRSVRIINLPSSSDAHMTWIIEDIRTSREEVPQDILEILDNSSIESVPTITYRKDLFWFVCWAGEEDGNIDFYKALDRGYFYGIICNRKVRIDVRHCRSELKEWYQTEVDNTGRQQVKTKTRTKKEL